MGGQDQGQQLHRSATWPVPHSSGEQRGRLGGSTCWSWARGQPSAPGAARQPHSACLRARQARDGAWAHAERGRGARQHGLQRRTAPLATPASCATHARQQTVLARHDTAGAARGAVYQLAGGYHPSAGPAPRRADLPAHRHTPRARVRTQHGPCPSPSRLRSVSLCLSRLLAGTASRSWCTRAGPCWASPVSWCRRS